MEKVNSSDINALGSVSTDFRTLKTIQMIIIPLCVMIDVFGLGTNSVNIICFVSQGFKEPVNISLAGLAASDFGCLVTLALTNIFLILSMTTSDLSFEVLGVAYMVAGIPHLMFTRISSWITAVITLERCLCVLVPLQVKSIITPKKVSTIIIGIFIILTTSAAPEYAVSKLDSVFFPERNRTLLSLVSSGNDHVVQRVSYAVNSFVIPLAAFIIISVCTAILVVSLRKGTRWRKTATSDSHGSDRNLRAAKMVVMLSTVFIVSFVPVSILMLALAFEPELNINGRYNRISVLLSVAGFALESINSSVNIFIYYHMSRRYRNTFKHIFLQGFFTRKR